MRWLASAIVILFAFSAGHSYAASFLCLDSAKAEARLSNKPILIELYVDD